MRAVTVNRVFKNELGNEISMAVTYDQRGITVAATGPTSEVEHTWTPMEALLIRDLVNLVMFEDYSPQSTDRP